jgi:hypothetical protein
MSRTSAQTSGEPEFVAQQFFRRATSALRSLRTKKIYRLKEEQAFSLSLELGQREKVA